ncbi:hypothetical protein Tco_0513842 [Tanacetum coccineum]
MLVEKRYPLRKEVLMQMLKLKLESEEDSTMALELIRVNYPRAIQGIGSGSGPRCQDTILGDVNAQTRFEITSKQSIDPPLSRGYTLGSGEDSMKLIGIDGILLKLVLPVFVYAVKHMLMLPGQVSAAEVNPIIYTSCIEQFWATAKVQIVNGVQGTDCLPTTTIFEELARMGAKSTVWNEFNSSMASLIICLATNQKFNLSKYIFDAMVKHLNGGVLGLEKAKDAQAKEIATLKKRIQRLERKKMLRPTGLKRLGKVGMSRRVESSEDQESLGAPEDASKQRRSIASIDADIEMHVEAKVDEKDE